MQTQADKNASKRRLTGLAFVLAAASLDGLIPFFTKTAYQYGAGPYTVVAIRAFFSAAALGLAFPFVKGLTLRIGKRHLRDCCLVSVLYALTELFLSESYRYMDSGAATAAHFTYPIIVMLLEALLYREKLTVRRCLLALMCLTGVVLLYAPDGSVSARGLLYAFGSALVYGADLVFKRRTSLSELPTLTVIWYESALSGILIAAAGLLTGQFPLSVDPRSFWAAGVLGLISTALCNILLLLGIRRCGDVDASLAGTFEPLVGILVGLLVFAERPLPRAYLGMALILAASVLLVMPEKNK